MKTNKKWTHIQLLLTDEQAKLRADWCKDNIKDTKWKYRVTRHFNDMTPPAQWQLVKVVYFSFKTIEDITLFNLTWRY